MCSLQGAGGVGVDVLRSWRGAAPATRSAELATGSSSDVAMRGGVVHAQAFVLDPLGGFADRALSGTVPAAVPSSGCELCAHSPGCLQT